MAKISETISKFQSKFVHQTGCFLDHLSLTDWDLSVILSIVVVVVLLLYGETVNEIHPSLEQSIFG